MTVRYDVLSERWLDRAVEWLNDRGVHSYFLLDQWEVPEFERRFSGLNRLGVLKSARVFEFRGGVSTVLYDALQEERPGEHPVIVTGADVHASACPEPEAMQMLELKD
jgi:hypothetical protein